MAMPIKTRVDPVTRRGSTLSGGRTGWRRAIATHRGVFAVIRIIKADEPARTTITVDGRFAGGDYIEAVETCCNQAISKGKPVLRVLRDVSVIGEDGRELLRRLAAEGIGLRASGIYNSYIVGLVQPDGLPQAHRRC